VQALGVARGGLAQVDVGGRLDRFDVDAVHGAGLGAFPAGVAFLGVDVARFLADADEWETDEASKSRV
jgi:methyl coenzyme M reductase beta subunit